MKSFVACFLFISFHLTSVYTITRCTKRGGCFCECSWANPNSCKNDDNSCCFGCCCSSITKPAAPSQPTKPTQPAQPTQSTTSKSCSQRGSCSCECSWANQQSCLRDDGSCCFGCCCSKTTPSQPSQPQPQPQPQPSSSSTSKTCSSRGGCSCDCSWANSQSCGKDDGSCCFGCCCSGTGTSNPQPANPQPSNPQPTGPEAEPSKPSTSSKQDLYCPSVNDLTVAYGQPQLTNQGWTIRGGGGAATKASFNLLGGSVEYDIDVSKVPTGVNANIYTISPGGISSSGFSQSNYCDGAKFGAQWCVEVDFIESNGSCGGQTTLHTLEGPGTVGCTAWGCSNEYNYNGKASFHMKVSFDADGTWTTYRDGVKISFNDMKPSVLSSDKTTLRNYYSKQGAVIYSSQWVGWVPLSSCGTYGNLDSATFSIRNLVINGSVVQGPTPKLCLK